jgi:hypothetical protein
MAEPRNPFAAMTDDDLDRDLADLGAAVAFPPTPDLAAQVRARIENVPAPVAEPRRLPVRRILAVAAIVVVALVAALMLSAGFRSAVADLVGVHGIRIEFVRETPTRPATVSPTAATTPTNAATPIASPTATSVGTGLLLGRPVTLAEAQAAVPYAIHLPTLPNLESPDEIYLRTLPDGNQMVSLIYYPAPGLPETEQTGVAVLLMQFEARENVTYIGKNLGDGIAWEFVDVGGNEALFISGTHELTLLPDPSLGCCRTPTRSAASVLLWEQDGLTLRLESALTKDQAVAIANSVAILSATPSALPAKT